MTNEEFLAEVNKVISELFAEVDMTTVKVTVEQFDDDNTSTITDIVW